ncbi:hypothetical protein ACWGJ2_24685 [Streptomyces sp. NPDC054796]
MSKLVVGQEAGTRSARAHALAVLRIRSTVLGVALLPAAVAVVLLVGGATGRIGPDWNGVRWGVSAFALLVLLPVLCVSAVVSRARPAVSPTVPLEERSAPDLYNLVRDLADRLDVPVPSAIALTPDCDSWLEDRTHPAQRAGSAFRSRSASRAAPVLVIGSPFMWWMRVAELRALLAPVVAGTGPSAHPDIAASRRFVRGLDAAVAVADRARKGAGPAPAPGSGAESGGAGARLARALGRAASRPVLRFVGRAARMMLRAAGPHAAEMERGVAAAAASRAQNVDYGLRTVAQEQVGLAYAGWDRLLTRVALPAWRIGRWPARLDAGVVSALTELSRRDRLAEGFASRLGERPACDLLEEPGAVDGAVSLLAARLFIGSPPPESGTGRGADGRGPHWSPVDWSAYPEEVVDVIWRTEASRLFAALDEVPDLCADRSGDGSIGEARTGHPDGSDGSGSSGGPEGEDLQGPTLARIMDRLSGGGGATDALAARITRAVSQADPAETSGGPLIPGAGDVTASPLGLPLQPPRSGRELMADHITAAVCCAAVDTAGASAGLDWLDGPALLVGGERRADLTGPVLDLVEEGDAGPLRDWLAEVGVRPDKPVRLV